MAYAIAILLGLTLFLGFRGLPGMKYNPPRRERPLAAAGSFALAAPMLVLIGIPIGFIPLPHLARASLPGGWPVAVIIFSATALPEEILFRSLIQNMLMQRFGANHRTLIAACFIFGGAHLDNGPQPLPNWRYMILAMQRRCRIRKGLPTFHQRPCLHDLSREWWIGRSTSSSEANSVR